MNKASRLLGGAGHRRARSEFGVLEKSRGRAWLFPSRATTFSGLY